MEPWVPQRPPQPRGRPPGSSKDPERGRWRDGYYWPVPYSWYNRERAHQRQDLGRSPQPQQDPRADQQQPHYASRPGEWHQPGSEADYYEGGYPSQFYLRPGTEDLYQTYHSPALREEYAYGSYYYHRHLQEERVPRQGSPYVWHEDYRDQKYLQEHQRANQKSPFAETQFQSKSQNPYKDSPASNSGQEEPGDLLPESLLTEAQKNKPSLTEESNLLRQHESGLSSSSYELSQYMANAFEPHDPTASTAWSPVQAEDVSAAGPKAPMKFYVPHMPVSFGPGGQLVCVGPSCPGDGETALVELHSMEVILNDSEEQEEMRTFPGPLVREDVHKVDIMTFCQQKAAQSRRSETQGSRDSALLWQLLVLLCRQNGVSITAHLRREGCLGWVPRKVPFLCSFTSTLALNDPLQTLFQLMSGRIPQAATCCGDKQWGDWRPHLAVILSNQGGDPELYQRTIVTMGDTLAGKGLVEAAHFCYLMAHVPFGYYTVKTDHLALLGSSHSQEFLKFATTEAIQRTEIFEYCQMLGRPKSFIPSFQVYKLLYASRLADYGLASQALHYCEAIGTALLSQGESSHPVLLVEVIKLAERLKLSDPLVLERHRRPGDRELEPDWLLHLRGRHKELQQKGAGDTGDPHPARLDISGARKTTEHTFYQDLSGHQGNSEALGGCSAQWPTPEQTGPAQLSPQQPFALQPGSYPAGGGSQQTGVPVPLYAVPETHPAGTLGSVAVTGAPGERAWEEAQQMHSPPGENTVVSSETFQPPDGQKVVFKPQVPQLPRARRVSESSAVSDKDDEEGSSDEADKKSSQSTAQRERPGEAKENTKSSGFGWFSWFRSKPTGNASPSGDEDSSDSPDSEETPRASSPTQPVLGLPPTPAPEPQTLPGTSAFSSDEGGGEVRGSASSEGTAEGPGHGGLSGPEVKTKPNPPPPKTRKPHQSYWVRAHSNELILP
uniref:Protein transport protein sec16 n=1 Tax=Sus scrofa TaxID=9823 RepID=A0A8D1M1F3_PIG